MKVTDDMVKAAVGFMLPAAKEEGEPVPTEPGALCDLLASIAEHVYGGMLVSKADEAGHIAGKVLRRATTDQVRQAMLELGVPVTA
jgi:hypothetical protein